MDEPRYEYDNFKVDPPRVDDGWYLVKDGITYKVEVTIKKWRFTKSINILTGEVYYPSNADRIRSMSDEELAEWLCDIAGWLPMYEGKMHPILDWLREEAEQ